ncbi:MAG: PAS domain S-box protein, partial [Chloroflexota bacterium]|nr:PAS domain S-box protein [Chloroflexota bacterium]
MTDSARSTGDAGDADWYGSARSRRARLAVVLALAGVYVSAFAALYGAAGPGLLALSVLPVGAAAWLFGLRGGLVAAVAVVTLSGLLLRLAGDEDWSAARWAGMLPRAGALILVGLAVGRLRDLGRQLQEQNAERLLAVAALRRSEGQLQMMVQHTLDIITVLGPDGTILFESPSVRQVLGYEVAERTGRSVFEMVHPDDRAQIATAFREAVQRPGPAPTVVFRFRHKNGDWRYLEAMGNHVKDATGAVTVVVNSRDVTERTYAAAQLQEMARLKDELVSVVSHELRNPLTAMVGFAELLLTREFDEQKRRGILTTIMREGRRISA